MDTNVHVIEPANAVALNDDLSQTRSLQMMNFLPLDRLADKKKIKI